MKKRIVVGATGASGQPLLIKCLEIIRESEEFESYLIMTESARLTLESETTWKVEEVEALADHVLNPEEIGAGIDQITKEEICEIMRIIEDMGNVVIRYIKKRNEDPK